MVMSPAAEMRDSGASAVRDLGPLAWVLDETRRSIEAASNAQAFARETDAARHRSGVGGRQSAAHGAPAASPGGWRAGHGRPVGGGTDGAWMEGSACAAADKCTEETVQALSAGFALMEYLKPRWGRTHARRLFPQYRRVLRTGGRRSHPSGGSVVGAWSWADPVVPVSAQPLSYDPEVRHRLISAYSRSWASCCPRGRRTAVISLSLRPDAAAGDRVLAAAAGFFEALGRD